MDEYLVALKLWKYLLMSISRITDKKKKKSLFKISCQSLNSQFRLYFIKATKKMDRGKVEINEIEKRENNHSFFFKIRISNSIKLLY